MEKPELRMEELEARADTKDEKALQLEAEAFTLLDANKVAEASLKGQQAKSLREAASTLRQKAVILYQQRPGQPLNQGEVGYLLDELDARVTKRSRQTVTTALDIGQDIFSTSQQDDIHLNSFLAGGIEMVAEQFLNSSPGLKEQWDQAECDEDIKRCLDKMFPALLQLLHGNECGTSRPTYYGTHERGLCGRSVAIDCTICEGSRRMAAHVGTFMEATLSLLAQHKAVVGQSADRVQALQDEQPGRDTWRTAILGKEAFQLWEFRTNRKGRCLQSRRTDLLPFSLDTESAGFQFFVRWLATDLRALGFISPSLPNILAPSGVAIDSVITGNDASHAYDLSEERPGALVYRVRMENNETAVAKVPANFFRHAREAASLRLIQELQSLEGRTIVLAGKAKVQLDHGVLDALIIKPYAQHIPLDTPLQTLVQYMRQYVETVGCLYDAGYLHGDLSYSNLLITEDQAIISDWETMVDVEEQPAAGVGGLQTGTPLFAAISILEGQPHTLSSELETLFNVMLYTLSGGVLHWQGMEKEHHHLLSLRRGAMLEGMFERIMLKRVKKECWPVLQRLRAVFFPDAEYRTDVSCQAFLNAL